MQNRELLNISQATKGRYGVYSIEFHETQNYTHVKRVNSDGSETLFQIGGGGGGTTYTAGTGIDITNGVISSTVVDTDTNNFVSNVALNGTDLEFSGSGGAFSGTVPLASLVSSGGTETNIIPYTGGTINTDTVGIYGLREGAEKIELVRTVASDTTFVLQAGTGVLGTNNFGILVVYVTINCSGLGGINLQYKNLQNNNQQIHGSNHLTSGNFALTFSYFGTTGLQLLAFTEL
jgi:hypothetical protein